MVDYNANQLNLPILCARDTLMKYQFWPFNLNSEHTAECFKAYS